MPRVRLIVALSSCVALAACRGEDAPNAARPQAGGWFVSAGTEAGLDFAAHRAAHGDHHMPDSMAGGVALVDLDGDDDLDLCVVDGVRDGAAVNRLYTRNADGSFTDRTLASGAGHAGYGMGIAAGDVDNDGDVDLYLANDGPDALLLNDGTGVFTDASARAGITNDAWSASAGMADLDGDGFLDVFVTNYLQYDPARRGADEAGRAEYPTPQAFPGVPDVLYRNNGDGTFTDVSVAAGIAARPGRGLGVLFADLDEDGTLDVYVANDGEPNVAWTNRGDGTFEDRALAMGLAVNAFGRPEASMGVALGDIDNDGHDDLFVTHLVQETNTLYRGRGAGHYDDGTRAAGLGPAGVDLTGFGTAFGDVDNDGDLDLVVVNGRVLRRVAHPQAALDAHWTPYAEPNQLFLNDGTGRFTPAPHEGGALGRDVEVSRGLVLADADGDGDLDAVVANANGTVRLYRNDGAHAGHWLEVRALDPALRRDVLGATVTVHAAGRTQRRMITTTESYLSARPPIAHFGLGDAATIDTVTVTWPDGTVESFPAPAPDRLVTLTRGTGVR